MRWLHVHPQYLIDEDVMMVVRLADNWREGHLPEAGGVGQQAAWTVAAIEIVLSAWGKLSAAREKIAGN